MYLFFVVSCEGTGRFSQDALENVYSQLRRRAGQTPSVLDCIRAFRLITLSQFVSSLKNTNYANDSDIFLVDCLSKKNSNSPSTQPNSAFQIDPTDFHALALPNDSSSASTLSSDLDILCYLAGSTTHAILKELGMCQGCKNFLLSDTVTEEEYVQLIHISTFGKLEYPNRNVFTLVYNANVLSKKYEKALTGNVYPLCNLIADIIRYISLNVIPNCCNLKEKIVQHFFTFEVLAYQISVRTQKGRESIWSRQVHPNGQKCNFM